MAVEEGEGEGEPAAGPVARADVVVETRRRAQQLEAQDAEKANQHLD